MPEESNWKRVEEELPVIFSAYRSPSLLFKVDGKEYAGYYQINGWFCCCEQQDSTDVTMAKGRKDATGADGPTWGLNKKPSATHWRYLRDE